MKKLLLILALICVAGLNQLFAANPIPCYNVVVSGKATFQESNRPITSIVPTDERRQMNIETSTSSSPTAGITRTFVVAKLYQIAGHGTMGPYFIPCGQTLSVAIDDQAWAVDLFTEDYSIVSVYTN